MINEISSYVKEIQLLKPFELKVHSKCLKIRLEILQSIIITVIVCIIIYEKLNSVVKLIFICSCLSVKVEK